MLLLHVLRQPAQYAVASIAALAGCARLLVFTRGFQATGVFLRMVVRVLRRAAPFLLVLAVVLVGFSLAFMCVYRTEMPGFENTGLALLSAYMFVFGELSVETDLRPGFVGAGSAAANATVGGARVAGETVFYDLYVLQLAYFVAYVFIVVCLIRAVLLLSLPCIAARSYSRGVRPRVPVLSDAIVCLREGSKGESALKERGRPGGGKDHGWHCERRAACVCFFELLSFTPLSLPGCVAA